MPAYKRSLETLKAEQFAPKVTNSKYKTKEEREKEDEEQALKEILEEEKELERQAIARGAAL